MIVGGAQRNNRRKKQQQSSAAAAARAVAAARGTRKDLTKIIGAIVIVVVSGFSVMRPKVYMTQSHDLTLGGERGRALSPRRGLWCTDRCLFHGK